MAKLLRGLGVVVSIISGLIDFVLSDKIVTVTLGFWGGLAAFVFAPITVIFAPWYAGFAWANWWPLAIGYGGGLLGCLLYVCGSNVDRWAIRGWLLVFVVFETAGVATLASNASTAWNAAASGNPSFVGAGDILLLTLLWMAGVLCGVALTLAVRLSARRYWLIFLPITMALRWTIFVLGFQLLMRRGVSPDSSVATTAMGWTVAYTAEAIAWTLYWWRSKRVRRAFGSVAGPHGQAREPIVRAEV